ncbi:hypothetical protein DICA4_F02476 [Diutina catenulata]
MTRRFQRVRATDELSPRQLGYSMRGQVTSVGDGDGFRFYHTPGGRWGGWGWAREVPSTRGELRGQTLSIRLAGVDAPERSHFGRPAQPYSEEALAWLQNHLEGKKVKIIPYSIDQYQRVVARAEVRTWRGRRDVGEQMLKAGMAVVYTAKYGAQYGGREQVYSRLEERARNKGRGLWANGGPQQTPMEYKKQQKMQAKRQSTPAHKATAKPKTKPVKKPARKKPAAKPKKKKH